jgi:hypothetical protein
MWTAIIGFLGGPVMLASREHPFRTRNGLAALVRRRWVDPNFRSVPDHVSKALKGSGLPFAPPAEAVEAYLRQLEQMGFVRSAPSEIWQPSQALRSKVQMAKDLRARPAKRLAEICEIVREELEGLPAEETGSFTFGAWVKSVLPGRPLAVADVFSSCRFHDASTNELRG